MGIRKRYAVVEFGKLILRQGDFRLALFADMFKFFPPDTKLLGFFQDTEPFGSQLCGLIVESKEFKFVDESGPFSPIQVTFTREADGTEKCTGVDFTQAYDPAIAHGINFIKCELKIEDIKVTNNCDCGTTFNAHSINCPEHASNKV